MFTNIAVERDKIRGRGKLEVKVHICLKTDLISLSQKFPQCMCSSDRNIKYDLRHSYAFARNIACMNYVVALAFKARSSLVF